MTEERQVTTKALERKFAQTAFRLSQERSDFLLPQVLDFVRKGKWLNLRPEYQRRLVWDGRKRSLFIESLLLNVPIPQIFLYEWELGRYEVMDGQQRLNAVVDYYENRFVLKGLRIWQELNGRRYDDLPDTLQRGLDRRRLSATVLLVESDAKGPRSDVRKLVFERLNTGGQHLNAQELRNCLYDGPFNDLLIKLSRKRAFAEKWDIPPYEENVDTEGHANASLADNRLYSRMIDVELVLRFFAFRQKNAIHGSVRSMLDKCMNSHRGDSKADLASLESMFESRLEVADAIFGQRAFRYENIEGKVRLSQALYDGVMVALDHLWRYRKVLIRHKAQIVKAVDKLLLDEDTHSIIVGNPNTAGAIVERIDLLTNAIRDAAGV